MSVYTGGIAEIESFINDWAGESQPMRDCFLRIFKELSVMNDVVLSFVARPGVSYSMRPKHQQQTERDLFAIVDIIDDNPDDRWLSVCFYGDMIEDPEQRGEVIPGGLAGSDGYCFDLVEDDEILIAYIVDRLKEAAVAAMA